jgi:hypothetical protein
MMIKSKRTLIGIAVAAVLVIGYIFYAMSDGSPAADDLKGWATVILIFIGISVAAQIVVQIAVHVVFAASVAAKEKDKDEKTIKRTIESEMAEDEMDERITLRSSHVGYGCIGIGFVLTLFALAFFEMSAALLLNILLMLFFLAMTVDGIVSIYLYEKGDPECICRGRRDE